MFSSRLSLLMACLVLATIGRGATAQCADWPGACPTLDQLGANDEFHTPLTVAPGHTPEDICPPTVNQNKELQLDGTDIFTTIDTSDRLYLRSYYNTRSAASTTEQFWFFDSDNDPDTGGSDAVLPTYDDTGPLSGQGPRPCGVGVCSTQFLPLVHASGFEYYIHSFGQGLDDFTIFMWDGMTWVDTGRPPGAVNLQLAEDNPCNDYAGDNGLRGVSYLPKSAVGIGDEAYRIFSRTYSCIECCGDHHGGEGEILLPGMTPCKIEVCGDCDASGFVDILDALRAASYDAGKATLSPVEYSNCNVLGTPEPSYQARVTILDALWIARSVVGIEVLECCTP